MNSVDCGATLDRVLVRQPTVNARYRPEETFGIVLPNRPLTAADIPTDLHSNDWFEPLLGGRRSTNAFTRLRGFSRWYGATVEHAGQDDELIRSAQHRPTSYTYP